MKIGSKILRLDPRIVQTSPQGKKFRLICLEKDLSKAPVFHGRREKYYWIATIKMQDSGKRVRFYFDHNDVCYKKEKA